MNRRKMLVRSIMSKVGPLSGLCESESSGQGWIAGVRQALGMTARQLANRLGVSQPRIARMEKNERNLKISTMMKIAEGLDCVFVYGFVPKRPLDELVHRQAVKKAKEVLGKVNANMALENQLADDPQMAEDLADDMIAGNVKRIWDE